MSESFSGRDRLSWAGAALGTSTLSGMFGAMLVLYYHDYLGMSPASIAWAAWAYGIWNAVNDPLFGYVSDRTRFAAGRRIPYIRWGAPVLALAFSALWLPSPSWPKGATVAWMIGAMFLYDAAITAVSLSDSALLPEVAETEAGRGSLQVAAAWASMGGMLLGFLIPDLMRPRGEKSLAALRLSACATAAAAAVLIVQMSFRFRERPALSLLPRPLGLRDSFSSTLRGRAFRVLAAQNFCAVFVQAVLGGAVFYAADYLLGMKTLGLLLVIFGSLAVGIPLADFARRRWGVANAQQAMLAVGGIGLCTTYFLSGRAMLAALAVGALGLAGPMTLTNLLFGQVADQDELVTGRRREGSFFGMNALLTKPAQGVALALIPALLESAGFITRAHAGGLRVEQSPGVLEAIRLLVGPIPGAAMLAGAAILSFYTLRGETLRKQEAELRVAHLNKERAWADAAR